MSEWPVEQLGRHCEKIGSGATPTGGKESYLDSGPYTLIRSQNVYNDGFKKQGLAFINDDQARKLNNVEIKENDILLNITGDSIARCCMVDNSVLPARVNQHVAIIRPKIQSFDYRYLRYFLVSPSQQDTMLAFASSGATRNALTKSMIEDFKVPIPPMSVQQSIGEILGSLDDRIELNQRANETLEAMARALFKSWFVGFDPVHAKAEGGKPEGMDAATTALFPAAFADNNLPEGWTQGTLGKIAESAGVTVQPNETSPDTPYIGLEHMPRRCIALSEWEGAGKVTSNKFAFKRGDFLFGKLRPYFHKVGIAAIDGISSTDILIVRPKQEAFYAFVLALISSDEFVKYTDQSSRGTKMPRTNWKDMAAYSIVLPDNRIAAAYNAAVKPMLEKIIANIHESRALAELRDTLLPKLISGELRIQDMRAQVKEAV